ncbi:MetQ/NlpA family ABC transporter substrate-binding protein [Reyranella sp. CPCC 100927]|uniref:MetQ/NlpA family ABC transporter substrate-binding protein n=1 Tax=Reyranella sp. CPCC 100927 TaxID=2599616 RepID=UPI0011B78481|nr:MetQ/NlpA family ABC transporter substrate-binding protein [Reyranella sp. CPCC 100927]TWT10912.1 MetQ/NlpA family ABC transporter substrate-binding protein [Reyranella sp. CPCC 100927]
MKKLLVLLAASLVVLAVPAAARDKLKVGISGGDGELIWRKVGEVAGKDGLDVQVVVFNDYLLPNAALDAGDLDANAFQHKPFLDSQIKSKGYKITAIADTIVAPIGLYSRKIKTVNDLPKGATIGIPNDPSNGGRALLLLQAQNLIKLKAGVGILPTVLDITENPKSLRIKELDAAQLPRSLDDLNAAVINTNYALQADLWPGKDSIAIEAAKDNPYGNVIAVRTVDKDKPVFRKLVAAYHTDVVRQFILETFKGSQIPVF